MRKVSGEITAFLSLIFVLMVSFILALTESASIQISKNQRRLDSDLAAFSVFGEYQKELWDMYSVFALDSTYGTGEYDENMLRNRLAYYGATGIAQEITDIQLLTDNGGQAFREQVLAWMEERTGIALVRDLTNLAAGWEEQEVEGQELSEHLNGILTRKEEFLPEEADSLVHAIQNRMLELILPREFSVSDKAITLSEQLSVRSRLTGRGSFPAHTGVGGLEEKILFEQYIIEKFSCATDQKSQTRTLEYELEYLLEGKERDTENLAAVLKRLLFFRFAANYAYLMSDAQKQSEAELFAAAIAVLLLQPEAVEAIKQMILILWGLGESVVDLRVLLKGERVMLVKTEETWQLQVSSLFELGSTADSEEGADAQEGLDYVQYLQILLFLEDEETLTLRTLDRVEENLRKENGVDSFRADACVTKIKLRNTAEIWNGFTYTFPAYYGYL